jgi:hypothetical protein
VDSGGDKQRQEGTRSLSSENIMPPQCRTIVLFVKENLAGGYFDLIWILGWAICRAVFAPLFLMAVSCVFGDIIR